MVTGLEKFRAFFGDHADDFVVIGGVAMRLLLEEAALSNRNTNDTAPPRGIWLEYS